MIKGENPKVSVIIACHNGEAYIDQCLNSIVNQTYKNLEILICDDASEDCSREQIRKWRKRDNRIRLFCSRRQIFPAGARNACIKKSTGQFLVIQDVDDISKLNRIETLLNELLREPNIDFVSSTMNSFESKPQKNSRILKVGKEYPTKFDFLWGQPFNHPATMFRRECVIKTGGYHLGKNTARGEDYDLFMRLYASGFKGKNITVPLYWYRLDKYNLKRRTFTSRINEIGIRFRGYRKLGISIRGIPFLFKPIVSYVVQLFRYNQMNTEE